MRRRISVMGSALAALVGVTIVFAVRHETSSAVIRTTIVGQHLAAIASDSRTSRAFLLDAGSLARNAGGGIVEGTIHVLDTRTGRLVRTDPAGTAPGAVAVDEQTRRVFVLNSYMHNGGQGTVTVVDAGTGRLVRTTEVGDGPVALTADAGAGRVFVLNQNNGVMRVRPHYSKVSVLDAATGQSTGALNALPAQPVDDLNFDTGTLALDARRHRVLLTVRYPRARVALEVFDATSNRLVSRLPLGAFDDGDIVVSARTGRALLFGQKRILVLDSGSGRILHVIPTAVFGQAVVDERTERIFVAQPIWSTTQVAPTWGRTDWGKLAVFDARSGALVRVWPMAWPDGVAVDERTGHLLISHAGHERNDGTFAGNGHVDVRDGRTGRLLHTITVGLAPGAMAVDTQTEHLLVVNSGGTIPVGDPWGWVPRWLRQRLPPLPPPPGPTQTVPGSVSVIALNS